MSNSLLYARQCPVTDKISIEIPTVGQIMEREAEYFGAVTSIIATPYDFMVQLYDAGIEFDSINEFDLFLLLFPSLRELDTSLIFGDLDLKKFEIIANQETGKIALVDQENDITIDRGIHFKICRTLCEINELKQTNKKPGNGEARRYMIERMRVKQKRAARKKQKSQLEDQIVAMVNTEQFKYDYLGVLDLTIYQFRRSVSQVIRKVNYDNLMVGCYTGNIKTSELSNDQLDWITSKQK